MDELYEKKKQTDMNIIKSYNKILEKIHSQIKQASRQKLENQCCWFVVPEFVFGIPRYDVKSCIVYIIQSLEENGFNVKYTHPNLLLIAWNHWVPDYVRMEYKKFTGVAIDGFGKEIPKKEEKEVKLDKKNFKSINTYKSTGTIYSEELLKGL